MGAGNSKKMDLLTAIRMIAPYALKKDVRIKSNSPQLEEPTDLFRVRKASPFTDGMERNHLSARHKSVTKQRLSKASQRNRPGDRKSSLQSTPQPAKRTIAQAGVSSRKQMMRLQHSSLKRLSDDSRFATVKLHSAHIGNMALTGKLDLSIASFAFSSMPISMAPHRSHQRTHRTSSATFMSRDAVARATRIWDAILRTAIWTLIAQKQHRHGTCSKLVVRGNAHRKLQSQTSPRPRNIAHTGPKSAQLREPTRKNRAIFATPAPGHTLFAHRFNVQLRNVGARGEASGVESAAASKHAARTQNTPVVLSATYMQLGGLNASAAGTPLSAPRIGQLTGQRSHAHMSPVVGHQTPAQTLLEKLLNPRIPGEEDLFSLTDTINRATGERIMSYIVKQLAKGPEALGDGALLDEVNTALSEPISKETWHELLKETLTLATKQIKVFDDGGLRKFTNIHTDAAILLDLDVDELAEWETHFGINSIADSLVEHDETPTQIDEELIKMIKQQLAERACSAFEHGDYRDALLYSFETRIQWAVARHSAISDSDEKIATTAAFIKDIAQKNRIAVSRVLALIVRHSKLDHGNWRRTHPMLPQWGKHEIRKLIAIVMEDMPNVMSDSCLRTQLTEQEKTALNKAIVRANYSTIMERLSKMSSDRPIEDFLDTIAEADESGRLLLDIVLTMARNRDNQEMS